MEALVWHDVPRGGMDNMAIDETMAQFARQEGCLILRIYYWSQPFLSLGYFQNAEDRLADPLIRDLPYTRRLSGGGAIIHDREITYSLAIPDGTGSKSPASQIYSQVHAAISDTLRTFGYDVHTVAELGSQRDQNGSTGPEPFLCFSRRADADLVIEDQKIVGSAQRRISGVVLQHGSILVGATKHAPYLLGLSDLCSQSALFGTDFEQAAGQVSVSLLQRLPAALGDALSIESRLLREDSKNERILTIVKQSRGLVDSKYATALWKDKR
jgi:lipoate-protein ligase A